MYEECQRDRAPTTSPTASVSTDRGNDKKPGNFKQITTPSKNTRRGARQVPWAETRVATCKADGIQ